MIFGCETIWNTTSHACARQEFLYIFFILSLNLAIPVRITLTGDWKLLIRSQADHRIDFRGATRGKIAGQHGDTHENERGSEEGERVAGGDAE